MRQSAFWRSRLLWVVLVACTAVLWWRQQPGRGTVPGLVTATRHRLGPVEAGRLAAVYVAVGDTVSAGQPVARLDCGEVDADVAVERARLQECLAEAETATTDLARQARDRRMQIETDLGRIRANLAAARGRQDAETAEMDSLGKQLAQLDGVLRNRIAQADQFTALRTRYERLARQTLHGPAEVQAWAESAEQVRQALDALESDEMADRLRPLTARIDTQSRRLDQLLERRERCTLRSPADARVSELLFTTGDTVPAGAAVVVLVGTQLQVSGYVPVDISVPLAPADPVVVSATDRAGAADAHGIVQRIGPDVLEMPPRLWLWPNRPRFGRVVEVRLGAAADLVPGELVSINPGRGGAQAAPAPAESPAPLQVPEALARRTRFEPSGLVWLPERNRVLIVSDDTGFAGPNEHPPWVFSATVDGHVDPDPLQLEGVKAVSDLESATRSPEGNVYLLASQSISRSGRRPVKRQWLLRTRDTGDVFTVTGRVAFYDQLLSRLDGATRAALGATDDLDIEGMAWHDGGLLLGLKSPLSSNGQARVWYLSDVDTVLRPDAVLGAGQLRAFATVTLPTCAAGAPGGIADLLLDGQRLFLLSTLPDGPPCGSAWTAPFPMDGKAPRKLADWPDVKPEGIARVGDGTLLVVFDAGAEAARFVHLRPGSSTEAH
jgi:multidrug resistance efflux pump